MAPGISRDISIMSEVIMFFSVFTDTINLFFLKKIATLPFKFLTIMTSIHSTSFVRCEQSSFVVTWLNLIDLKKIETQR